MKTDLYVYYRVPGEHAMLLQERVSAMQQSLSQDYGIVTALKRRPEEKEGRHTWMEVYLAVAPDFAAILDKAVAQAGLSDLIEGKRNMETFLDVSPCV